MKANNELTIAANNKNNANRSPASYVIQTDSAPVSLEASDITLSTKGKRLVRGIRVDTTQTDLPGSVTLQASGALHVQSELVDDSNVKSGVQQLYGIYLGTGTVTGTAKNISVAVNGAKGLSGASIRAIEIPGNKVGNASLSGERNLILQAEDTLSISAEGKGATTAINAHAIGTNSPEKTVLKGGTVTITSNGDSDKWGTVVGISNGSDGNENAAKGEMTITATKGLVTIQAESKNGGAQGIHTSNNAETNIKGNSVAVSAKANNATVVKGVWATSPLETPAQLTMTATSGKVTINSKSTSGAAVGIQASDNGKVTIAAPETEIVSTAAKKNVNGTRSAGIFTNSDEDYRPEVHITSATTVTANRTGSEIFPAILNWYGNVTLDGDKAVLDTTGESADEGNIIANYDTVAIRAKSIQIGHPSETARWSSVYTGGFMADKAVTYINAKDDGSDNGSTDTKVYGNMWSDGTEDDDGVWNGALYANFTGANSSLTGQTWYSLADDVMQVSFANGAQWNVTGNSRLTTLTNKAGKVDLSYTTRNQTVTTTPEYQTVTTRNLDGDNGVFIMDTDLQESADNKTVNGHSDQLILDQGPQPNH